jgi:transcriptional regulator with XRE-family HTH domain
MEAERQPSNNELGQMIRSHRTAAGLSMSDLAKQSGVDRSTIYRIETGEFAEPSPQRLQRIAAVLGTDVEDYFGLAGYFTTHGMPNLGVYLRTKYDASPEIASDVENYFHYLRQQGSNDDSPGAKQQH